MDNLLSQVLNCKTYNISNHALLPETTNYTSNIWSALYNMMLRTKSKKYIYHDDQGYAWVHIPQKYILSAVKCSLRTVQRAVSALKDLGLLVVKSIRCHASNRNYYRIPVGILKNLISGDTLETAPDKDIDMRHFVAMHTGNYTLNTNKKIIVGEVTVPAIELTPEQVEQVEKEMSGSWTDLIFSKPAVKTKEDIAITAPIEPGEAISSEIPYKTIGNGQGGMLGGFISKITKGIIPQAHNAGESDPITTKKQQIDRSTMAGDLKKIHKHILDLKGIDGLRFIISYLDSGRIKIEYNEVDKEHICVISDNYNRDTMNKVYGDLFSIIGVKIIG